MVTYRCDRCGSDTTPDQLYEVELIFTPRDLDGNLDTDNEDRKTLGDLCALCTDLIEPRVRAMVNPPSAGAVDPSAADPGTPTPREPTS